MSRITEQPLDYLPISKVNTVVFCPRRYYIESILQDTLQNHHMIEGSSLHERSQRPGENRWVWSDSLGLSGKIDQLKQEDGQWVITELKKGYLAEHESDMVQLCALAICFEESHAVRLDYGYIYYERSRRRLRVVFDDTLREKVSAAVARMRSLAKALHYPDITDNPNKCRGCSVKEACQPELQRKTLPPWKLEVH